MYCKRNDINFNIQYYHWRKDLIYEYIPKSTLSELFRKIQNLYEPRHEQPPKEQQSVIQKYYQDFDLNRNLIDDSTGNKRHSFCHKNCRIDKQTNQLGN